MHAAGCGRLWGFSPVFRVLNIDCSPAGIVRWQKGHVMGKVIFFLGACPKKFYFSKIDAWIAGRSLNIVSFTVCSSPWGWYIGDDDGEPIEA